MEEKTLETSKTVVESENELGSIYSTLSEKEKSEIKIEKNKSQNENLICDASIKTESENEKTQNTESINKVLKRKVTEDGVTIERVLSAGEASSGFETVSSIDSQADIEDLDLVLSSDENDLIVTVEIENDLAFRKRKEKDDRLCYWKSRSKSPVRYNYKSDYGNRRQDGYRNFSKHRYRQKNNEDLNYKYNKRNRESSEREDNTPRRYSNRDLSRSSRDRRDSYNSRSRFNRSTERNIRSRVSRSPERNMLKIPSYKGRKGETGRSGSFDRNSAKSNSKRDSPPRKRKKSPLLKSPTSSVWRRLGSQKSPVRNKKGSTKKPERVYSARKKERTPFLVELERKLQEAERMKNLKKGTPDEKDRTVASVNSTVSESVVSSSSVNQNSSVSSMYMPTGESVYPLHCTPMPAFSMENLPLVPGPTGLPVHITMTGEQIPHDMDGRRIPVGPSGFYLPLDPTGRLFPHIVSPGNQAVPIHMTEDGVLRLPNSEPVPYGPGHQLPVNIDGKVILIGPDSKPLYPCPDLPKQPPFDLLQMVQRFETAQNTAQMVPQVPQIGNQQTPQMVSQMPQILNQKTCEIVPRQPQPTNLQAEHSTNTQRPQKVDEAISQLPKANLNLSDFIQNSTETINKSDLLKKYKKKVQEKSKDVLRCIEIEKNLGVNPSKGGVKRSIPMKLSQKKTHKDDNSSSGSDMVLDSNDSDSTSGARFGLELAKGSAEEIFLSSDEEQDNLKIDCDNESPKKNADSKSDDLISKKIQQAIKSLCEKNYKPPAFGRFIISDLIIDPVINISPNDSPLIRNRIKLPFLTPNFSVIDINNKPVTKEKTAVNFKFLSQKKPTEKVEKRGIKYKTYNAAKVPVFTFDFSMQCDFTSITINNLKLKVSELETEMVKLKNVNANLLESYRNVQGIVEKKENELRTALLEIQEKHDEIEFLKRSLDKTLYGVI